MDFETSVPAPPAVPASSPKAGPSNVTPANPKPREPRPLALPVPTYNDEELEMKTKFDNSESIFHSRRRIALGDLVIVFMSRDNISPLIVTAGQELHNKYGRYAHDDMVGLPFGSKMHSGVSTGYIHLLAPTPQLWTVSLPHRTQILYLPDISFVMDGLGVRVGGRVAEAGTGSGSMSHSLAQTLGPTGRLFSFEYHATRCEKAKKEFDSHGLKQITLQHKNVCKDGFGDEATDVDAVFLDLPAPWEAIPHAVKALRTDISTKICCFSPCIEQVTRTVTALDSEGFSDIAMYEVLSRSHEIVLPQPNIDTVASIAHKLKVHSRKKEVRRRFQMLNARERKKRQAAGEEAEGVEDDAAGEGKKRSREDGEEEMMSGGAGDAKKAKLDVEEAGEEAEAPGFIPDFLTLPSERTAAPPAPVPAPSTAKKVEKPLVVPFGADPMLSSDDEDDSEAEDEEPFLGGSKISKPAAEMRGHTSYLTFATMISKSVRDEMEEWDREKEERKRGRAGRLIAVEVNGKVIGIPAVTIEQGTQDSAASQANTTIGSEGMTDVIASMTEEELAMLTGPPA